MKYICVLILWNFLRTNLKIGDIIKWFCSFYAVSRLRNNKGVLIVEYVLLLLCCVTIAALVQHAFELGADENSSGWIINQWIKMLHVIAKDV